MITSQWMTYIIDIVTTDSEREIKYGLSNLHIYIDIWLILNVSPLHVVSRYTGAAQSTEGAR